MGSGAKSGALTYVSSATACALPLLPPRDHRPDDLPEQEDDAEDEQRSQKRIAIHQLLSELFLTGKRASRRATGRGQVEPARVKRVALTQPHERKQATPRSAVVFEARDGVARARRLEAADVAQQRRQRAAGRPDEPDEEGGDRQRRPAGTCFAWAFISTAEAAFFALSSASSQVRRICPRTRSHSRVTSARDSSCVPLLAMATQSIPSGNQVRSSRKHSRHRRLMRLRTRRAAQLLRRDDAEARRTHGRRACIEDEHEVGRTHGAPSLLNTLEIRVLTDATLGTEGRRAARCRASLTALQHAGSLLVDRDRQAMTALAAAVRENLADHRPTPCGRGIHACEGGGGCGADRCVSWWFSERARKKSTVLAHRQALAV